MTDGLISCGSFSLLNFWMWQCIITHWPQFHAAYCLTKHLRLAVISSYLSLPRSISIFWLALNVVESSWHFNECVFDVCSMCVECVLNMFIVKGVWMLIEYISVPIFTCTSKYYVALCSIFVNRTSHLQFTLEQLSNNLQ